MKNGKSPGEDGIPKEFYEFFIDELKDILCELLNNIRLNGEIPESQKNAIVKLLFKKGDHRELKNWRPVSLLNTDYKILSKILTARLSKIMHIITPIEQKCGVKNRQMNDVIRNIDLIIDQMDEGYLVLIDQQKAFDRVNQEYLIGVLEKVGINGKMLDMVKAMYNNITSQIMVNGKATGKIKIERSIRQGCPFSMLLFVLSSIPLINMIKEDDEIQGFITKRNRPIKIQSYADDNTVIIKNIQEYNQVLKIYNKHALASEAKINVEKTEILKIGESKKREPEEVKNLLKQKVKILGAWFYEDKTKCSEGNLKDLTEKVKSIIEKENERNLTIIGKVLMVNSKMWSLIWPRAWLIDTKDVELKKLLKNVKYYIQRAKCNLVYEQITKSKDEGGLGLINLTERIEAIKCKQLQNIDQDNAENDTIQYLLGHRMKTLFNVDIRGPKKEIYNSKFEKTFDLMMENKELIKTIKDSPVRKILRIIFEKEQGPVWEGILKGRDTRHIAINYKTAYGLMPIWREYRCPVCNDKSETTLHLFMQCVGFNRVKDEIDEWVDIITNGQKTMDAGMLILGMGLENDLLRYVISEYKLHLWKARNLKKFENKDVNEYAINRSIEGKIRFYVKYLIEDE